MERIEYIYYNESGYKITVLAGENTLCPEDDNVDVFVDFVDGQTYTGTFFTLRNVERVFEKNRATGECDYGKYFYCRDMILVEALTPEIIRDTIRNLVETGEYKDALQAQAASPEL